MEPGESHIALNIAAHSRQKVDLGFYIQGHAALYRPPLPEMNSSQL